MIGTNRWLLLWFVGTVAWVGGLGIARYPDQFVRDPHFTLEDLRWTFDDCRNLPHAADASPADIMVPRVLCLRAQRSHIRRHAFILLFPPLATLATIVSIAFLMRRMRSDGAP